MIQKEQSKAFLQIRLATQIFCGGILQMTVDKTHRYHIYEIACWVICKFSMCIEASPVMEQEADFYLQNHYCGPVFSVSQYYFSAAVVSFIHNIGMKVIIP